MNPPSFSDLTLEDLLPQRGDMLLIQEVLEVDRTEARTLCRPKPSWPMADAKGVPPLILIELAAQTAGVCNGWDRIQNKGTDSDPMGWIVGIKKAEFSIDHLPFACDIISWAKNTFCFDNLREVACEQHIDGQLISRMTLQLFQAKTDE
ncbi:MAG: hypothetical protein SD837_04510 [Candidatus Electrothrix scaldis]|nr:MAG: hypothetical protein SD837_04510 [Candidatus Electrothrix sp. GW3-3]